MGSLLSIYTFIIALFISTVIRAVAVTLHGKRDFADGIKLEHLKTGETILNYPSWSNLITSP